MDWLVSIGTVVSIAGLIGILYSALAVSRAKKAGLDDAALRDRLSRILPLNIGSLLLSILGLMMVIVGVLLG